ncbi:DUF6226 family protein [Microlunatus sp. Y2014]|uniref:DUF6226 family protein n=1 Tax=Microlunatus sp. Y2014 TaxID=3418488 RepID=UPI003DA728F8
MVTVDELRTEVSTRADRLGLPSWPAPRPPMASPREEEYSRITEPRRYRIVHERARVWAQVLTERLDVTATELAPGTWQGLGSLDRFDRGVRLSAALPGTLDLLLLELDVVPTDGPAGATLPVLGVCVDRPDIGVTMQPDCGCDACDTGSADLLSAIDEPIMALIGGPYVILHAERWHAQWHHGGGQSSSDGGGPDHRELMQLCVRLAAGEEVQLPSDATALIGRSWLPSH